MKIHAFLTFSRYFCMGIKRVLILLMFSLGLVGLTACSNEGKYTPLASVDSPSENPPEEERPGLKGYNVVENAMITPTKAFVEDGETVATGYSGFTTISTSSQKLTKVAGYEIYQQIRF